jgi:hypothetical protein
LLIVNRLAAAFLDYLGICSVSLTILGVLEPP